MLFFRTYPELEAFTDALEPGDVDADAPSEPDDDGSIGRPWWKRPKWWVWIIGAIAGVTTSIVAIHKNVSEMAAVVESPSLHFDRVSDDQRALLFFVENPRDIRYQVNGMTVQIIDPVIGEWLSFGTPSTSGDLTFTKGTHAITMRIDYIVGKPNYFQAGKDRFFELYGSKKVRFVAGGLDKKGKEKRIADCVVPLSYFRTFIAKRVSPEDAVR